MTREGAMRKIARKKVLKSIGSAVLSLLSGVMNALFGGGGGMLVVPVLRYGLDLEEKRAHASSIAVILPLSLLSAICFTARGVYDFKMGAIVACGAAVGAAVGAIALRKIPKEILSVLFYGVMIYAGVRFLR